MGLFDHINRYNRRLLTGAPSAVTPAASVAWESELVRAYSTLQPYAGPLTSQDNITGETREQRVAYRLKMLKEPAVWAPLLAKTYAVASLPVQVLPENKNDPKHKAAAKWVDWTVKRSSGGWPHLLLNLILPGQIDGFSIVEKKMRQILPDEHDEYAYFWALDAAKGKDSRFIRFRLDTYKNVTAVQAMNAGQGAVPLNPADFIIFTHLSLFGNPFGISALRPIYRAANLIEAAIKLRSILLENFSGPFISLKQGDVNQRAQAQLALKNARSMGYIIIDPADDIEVLNLATAATDQFQAAIEDMRKEIQLGLRGASLQSLESSTPQGNSETHSDQTKLFDWYLKTVAETCINEQLIPDLVEPNYGKAGGRPYIQLGAVDPDKAEGAGKRFTVAKSIGLPVSKDQAYEELNLEPPKDPNDVLGGPPPAPMPMSPGGQAGPPAVLPGPNTTKPVQALPPVPQRPQAPGGGVPPELLAAMLQAAQNGDQNAVDQLGELGSDPAELADVIGEGPAVKKFSWTAAQSKGGKVKAVGAGEHQGRVLYGAMAEAALARQQKGDNGESTPPTPQAKAQQLKQQREPARQDARGAWQAAVSDPGKVQPHDLPQLAQHLHTLTRDELREMSRALEQKVGGLKRDLVDRLLAHVGAKVEAAPGPQSAEKGGVPAPKAEPHAPPPVPPPPAASPSPRESAPPTDTFAAWQHADREHVAAVNDIGNKTMAEGRKYTKAETAHLKALKAKAEAAKAAHEAEQAKQEEASPAPVKAGDVAAMPLGDFAAKVNQAAAEAKHGWGNDKAWIADIHDRLMQADPSLTEDEFKRRLQEASQHGLVTLSRADMDQVHHPDWKDRSEVESGGAKHHFVVSPNVPVGAPDKIPRTREQAAKRAAATGEGAATATPVKDSPANPSTAVDKSISGGNIPPTESRGAAPGEESKVQTKLGLTAKDLDLLPGETRSEHGGISFGPHHINDSAPADYVHELRGQWAEHENLRKANEERIAPRLLAAGDIPDASEQQVSYYNDLVRGHALPQNHGAAGLAGHYITSQSPRPTTRQELSAAIDLLKNPVQHLKTNDKAKLAGVMARLSDRLGGKLEKVGPALAAVSSHPAHSKQLRDYEAIRPLLFGGAS